MSRRNPGGFYWKDGELVPHGTKATPKAKPKPKPKRKAKAKPKAKPKRPRPASFETRDHNLKVVQVAFSHSDSDSYTNFADDRWGAKSKTWVVTTASGEILSLIIFTLTAHGGFGSYTQLIAILAAKESVKAARLSPLSAAWYIWPLNQKWRNEGVGGIPFLPKALGAALLGRTDPTSSIDEFTRMQFLYLELANFLLSQHEAGVVVDAAFPWKKDGLVGDALGLAQGRRIFAHLEDEDEDDDDW